MFCPKCGEKIDDTSIFCMKCGAKIVNDTNSTTNATTTNNARANTTTNKVVQSECTRCSYCGEMEFVQYKFGFLIRFGVPCVLFVILIKFFNLVVAIIADFIVSELLAMAKVVRCPSCHSKISIFSNCSIEKCNVKRDNVANSTINNIENKVKKTSTNNVVGKFDIVLYPRMKIVIIMLVMIGIGILLFSKLWENGDKNKQEITNQVESIEESTENQQNDNVYDGIKEEKEEELIVENEQENVGTIVDENDNALSDEVYLAIINTYYGVSNYMNGNKLVKFDIVALQTILITGKLLKKEKFLKHQ